jgi:hypothetical protein
MSVNRAYITSLWTTGILVASSLLVLAVTSAIVAYDHGPKSASVAPVDRVTVAPAPAGKPTAPTSSGVQTGGAAVTTVRVAPFSAQPGSAPTALRRPNGAPRAPQGGRPTAPTTGTSTPAAAPSQRTVTTEPTPKQRDSSPLGDAIRTTGDTVGGVLTPVSPAAGQAVTQVGDTAANVADQATGSPPADAGL